MSCSTHPLLVFILAAFTAGAVACASPVTTAPNAPASLGTMETISPEQVRSDFAILYQRLRESHYDLYVRRSRDDYDALFQRMHEGFDAPMKPGDVQRSFQRFVAYGNVAHATIAIPFGEWEHFRAAGGKAFPLSFRVADEKVYVWNNYSGRSDIAQGDEVLSVDGQPALRWLERLRTLISADNDYLAYAQMERQLPMLVWRQSGEVDGFEVVLANPEGGRRTVEVPARSRAAIEASAQRPQRFELEWNVREARILEDRIAYLRPGPFYDNRPEAEHPWDPATFRSFVDKAFADFISKGAVALLIDLRDNPGGDNSFSDPLIAWFADKPFRFSPGFDIRVSEATIESNRKRLDAQGGAVDSVSAALAATYEGQPLGSRVNYPVALVAPREGERFDGRVYLLINRHSYSNAVLVAAIVQDYRFGTVLGEETADLASTYGAQETFTLPATGIEVGFPKAKILRPNGDPEPRGVIPDMAIDTPLDAVSEDVVLQRAVTIVSDAGR